MAWFNEKGNMQDIVISTRVRFARNLEDYPFTSRLDSKKAEEIIEKVKNALPDYRADVYGGEQSASCHSQMEMHFVSSDFAEATRKRALLTGEGECVQIMVCEEDHLRIQSIVAGFAPELAFSYAARADDILCKKLKIAYSDKYGYLTLCPTNLGAAMRVSAMLCLPALRASNSIERFAHEAGKMGITVRGMYGEGSSASGALYQISNRASLGMGEREIIKMMSDVVNSLVEAERKGRLSLSKSSKFIDTVCRRVGVLKNAYLLSSDEFTSAFCDLKLGISQGIIEGLSDEKLSELLIAVQPATLSLTGEGLDNIEARDLARAKLVRKMLEGVSLKP